MITITWAVQAHVLSYYKQEITLRLFGYTNTNILGVIINCKPLKAPLVGQYAPVRLLYLDYPVCCKLCHR